MLRLLGFFLILYILNPAFLLASTDPKFGDISPEEWALKNCEFDPEATAIYLFSKGEMRITYGRNYSFEIHEKIKILDKEGLEYAHLKIPLSKNFDENVSSFKGIVHKIDDQGMVTKIKISKKELFNVDINESYTEERIVFPGVDPGDIIEYKYSVSTSNYVFPDSWYFQREIPVIHSKIHCTIESGLVYKYFINGSHVEKLKKEIGQSYIFSLENIPSYNKKEFVFNARKYQDLFRLQMESYYRYSNGAYTNNGTVDVASDWKVIVKNSNIHGSSAPYLKARKANSLSLSNTNQIIDSLYSYVSKEFNWDKSYRLIPEQTVNSFEKTKSGNSAELNLYLCGLLRSNGINASPLWISTRSYGQPLKLFPLITQFNHVMVYIETSDGNQIISAINKDYPPEYLNVEEYNELGFLFDPDKLEWIDIPNSRNNFEHIEITGEIKKDEVILTPKVSLKGLSALTIGTQYSNPPEKHPMTGLTSLEPEDQISLNWMSAESVEYPLEKIVIDQSGNIIYFKSIPGDLFFKRNPFTEIDRSLPVEMPFPVRRSISVKIFIPEGYELEELPKPVAFVLPNKKGKFVMTVNVIRNVLNISGKVEINDQLFTAFEYPYLKAFIDQIIEKQNLPLVLIPKK